MRGVLRHGACADGAARRRDAAGPIRRVGGAPASSRVAPGRRRRGGGRRPLPRHGLPALPHRSGHGRLGACGARPYPRRQPSRNRRGRAREYARERRVVDRAQRLGQAAQSDARVLRPAARRPHEDRDVPGDARMIAAAGDVPRSDEARGAPKFDEIWHAPTGIRRVTAVNNSIVGRRCIVTGFVLFLVGGVLALLMRTQLIAPENGFLDARLYNQLFTMHGTTMMFLFAVPIMEAFAVYLIPGMIGTRDLVFPRLSAFGYWCYLFGGILLYSSFIVGSAPNGGWFMYVPLTTKAFSPGIEQDFWLLGVTFIEISSIGGALERIVSILKTRAPGMSLNRMPIFAWYMLAVSFMIVIGFPPLVLGSILLEVE